MISYDIFTQTELKVGTVKSAERVAGSEKLLKLAVDLGELTESGEATHRQILAGIGKRYAPETLAGMQIVVVANLEPRALMGIESQGMLLAASDDQGPVLLTPHTPVPAGSGIK
ncbi:MAG: methionine--tRNA ligase [Patescibacteria group bacterium]